MGLFKQQERLQQRKKARQEEFEAKQSAREAAEEARQAVVSEFDERSRRREEVLRMAKVKQAAAKKSGTAASVVGVKRDADQLATDKTTATVTTTNNNNNKNNNNNNTKKTKTENAGTVAAKLNVAAQKKADAAAASTPVKPKHKQKVLLVSSRGISFRHRHLMNDLETLMPHSKKDAKLDTKSKLQMINELAELANCNSCIFFEARRREDLYLWLARTPNGPSIKFHLQNVNTMDELKMTGNCLKGTRHVLSFDKTFDNEPHLQLMKEMFTQVFSVPRTSRRVKPFIDHVLSFTIADNRVWIRNYQIVENAAATTDAKAGNTEDDMALVEIGPRFVLNPIRIFGGSFGGPTVYENPSFVSPSKVRLMAKQMRAVKYKSRVLAESERREKVENNKLEADPLDEVFE